MFFDEHIWDKLPQKIDPRQFEWGFWYRKINLMWQNAVLRGNVVKDTAYTYTLVCLRSVDGKLIHFYPWSM